MSTALVIGAGAVNCAAALHLKTADSGRDVVVVEPDYTYARAATGKGTGGVRQLFTLACGFSGHGFVHAVAVGRGPAEFIVDGGYRTLDLSRMGYQRILDERPYGEEGVR
jgi:glycine/D-amino acid oxidase-like deaminating enzyme